MNMCDKQCINTYTHRIGHMRVRTSPTAELRSGAIPPGGALHSAGPAPKVSGLAGCFAYEAVELLPAARRLRFTFSYGGLLRFPVDVAADLTPAAAVAGRADLDAAVWATAGDLIRFDDGLGHRQGQAVASHNLFETNLKFLPLMIICHK